MLDCLFGNIGKKIMSLAKVLFIIEAIGALFFGLITIFYFDLYLIGLLIFLCGPIVAYVSSWFMYAFGSFVDDINQIRYNLYRHIDSNKKRTSKNKQINFDDENRPTDFKSDFIDKIYSEPTVKSKLAVKLNFTNQCACGEMFNGRFCPICGRGVKK